MEDVGGVGVVIPNKVHGFPSRDTDCLGFLNDAKTEIVDAIHLFVLGEGAWARIENGSKKEDVEEGVVLLPLKDWWKRFADSQRTSTRMMESSI